MYVEIKKWEPNEMMAKQINLYLVKSFRYIGDYFYVVYDCADGETCDRYYLGDIESIKVYRS